MKNVKFTVQNTLAGAGSETVALELTVSPEEEALLRAGKPDALAPLFARVCREADGEFDYLGGCEERPETPRRLAVESWAFPAEP